MPDSRSGDPGSKASQRADSPGRSTRTPLAKIIIITGTPGVGKTRLANSLAKRMNCSFLDLGSLVKREKLYSRFDRRDRSYVIDEHRVKRRLARFFAENTRGVLIIEAHTVGSYVPKRPGMRAIVIRLDPVKLAQRLKARKWSRRKIWENVEAELIDLSVYESVRLLGRDRVSQIDSTGMRIGELLHEAERLMATKRWSAEVGPDWLGSYDPLELRKRV